MRLVSSRARRRPVIVTKRADNLSRGDMVIIWVLVGERLRVMIRPAMMLP